MPAERRQTALQDDSSKARSPEVPLGEQSRAVNRQILMVVLGNIGILPIGMNLGLPAVVMEQMKDENEVVHLNDSEATWFASVNTLSCPLGGLLCSYMMDKFGRRHTLYVLGIIFMLSWALMAGAVSQDSAVWLLMISRFIMGVAMGLGSAPLGVYSAEIGLPKIRGCLITITSIAVSIGILIIYFLGYLIRDNWHLIALICGACQIFALLCIIPMPETPGWLISKGRLAEAKQSLNYFRGLDKSALLTHPECIVEFKQLQESIQLGEGEPKMSFVRSLRLPEVYKPLLILIGLFVFQQISAVFVIIVYAVQIAIEAGVSMDPFLMAVLIGVTRLICTMLTGHILEMWGRRRAGMISSFGLCICMLLLAGQGYSSFLRSIPLLPVIAILTFVALSIFGLSTLPFFMMSEIFPQKVRGPASGLSVAIGFLACFCCVKAYPAMKDAIGNELVFITYGVMSFISVVYIYFVLPETRGRTLLEIEEAFRSGQKNRSDNNNNSRSANEAEEAFIEQTK